MYILPDQSSDVAESSMYDIVNGDRAIGHIERAVDLRFREISAVNSPLSAFYWPGARGLTFFKKVAPRMKSYPVSVDGVRGGPDTTAAAAPATSQRSPSRAMAPILDRQRPLKPKFTPLSCQSLSRIDGPKRLVGDS